MVIPFDEIKIIALSETDEWIKVARNDSTKYILHYYGKGTDEFLNQISGLENDSQLALRKKHAISNEFVTENLLRPIDNIWNAKGGSYKIDLPDNLKEQFKEKISNVGKGYNLKQYIKEVWRDRLFSDPNGLTYVEVTKDGQNAYLTSKSIFSIKNMKSNGIKPEYICFEPHSEIENKKEKSVKKKLWLVDDSFYYEIQIENSENVTILQTKTNTFGKVPAILNSSIVDTQRGLKISPIHKQVSLLDSYLIGHSVKEIYQFLHGYPVFWSYERKCNVCNGIGQIDGKTCTSCNGTGKSSKKDVSDAIILKVPEEGQPVLAPPSGYVQPDLETWREQRTELDWKFSLIYYSHWGTTTEKTENETATGRFIDVQPVNNRLNMYTDIAEYVHSTLLDLLGKFYFPASYKGSTISYGRRFLIETPDQVWEKYIKAKNSGAPVSAKNQLLEQYYESEYQNNQLLQDYYLKLVKIEPFVHNTIDQISKLQISETEKLMKIYFSDWLQTKEISEIIEKSLEDLKNDLKEYSLTKKEENGTTEIGNNGNAGQSGANPE